MNKLANAVRFLAIDMVEKANSGHPGMPMGMADIATVLFRDFLRYIPNDPHWKFRDRFILSNGHGSALLYACLYLLGYEKMSLEEIKSFRTLDSLCAGHPEYNVDAGIETTTGPLGQGFANAVGIALAQKISASDHPQEYKNLNQKTYVFCGDGCLSEGISYEASAFAGHYALNNLIVLFDDNSITIDGDTSMSISEDTITRFKAAGFNTLSIDGHNETDIYNALKAAQTSDKPVFIACKTQIGYGSPNKAGNSSIHGSPLGAQEVANTRENLNWVFAPFEIPDEILAQWRNFYKRNEAVYKQYTAANHNTSYVKLDDIFAKIADTSSITKNEATRASSGKVLEFLQDLPLIGGSADLTPSNCTKASYHQDLTSSSLSGKYIRYGIREHAMAGIMNGIALHGGFIPYGGTFLCFADYMRPSMRLAALMGLQVVYVLTHDSIGLGEDGPTHQPIEHLASLRAMHNMRVFRPADYKETLAAWHYALSKSDGPTVLALSRQALPQIENTSSQLCQRGGYIAKEAKGDLQVTIFATGSELHIAIEASDILEHNGISTRVVSMPCIELFYKQDPEYIMSITCNNSLKVGVEAAAKFGWERLIGNHGLFFGVNEYGKSSKAEDLYQYFGLTPSLIAEKIMKRLG